jgi:Big-like domain-containing protein/hemolysin type calcium-binding protein/Calx-beta domain-containing protein
VVTTTSGTDAQSSSIGVGSGSGARLITADSPMFAFAEGEGEGGGDGGDSGSASGNGSSSASGPASGSSSGGSSASGSGSSSGSGSNSSSGSGSSGSASGSGSGSSSGSGSASGSGSGSSVGSGSGGSGTSGSGSSGGSGGYNGSGAVAIGDYYRIAPGQTIRGADVLANDSYNDHPETYAYHNGQEYVTTWNPVYGFVTVPQHGSFTETYSNSTGSDGPHGLQFEYTPNPGFRGVETFTYYLSDTPWNGNFSTATVTILIDALPNVVNDVYSTPAHTQLHVAASGVLGNDTGCIGAALTVDSVGQPHNGTLSMYANGGFTYMPAAGFSGRDSFTYTATDGLLSASATVTIYVDSPIEAPTAYDDNLGTNYQTSLDFTAATLLANDTDPQNEPLTATIVDPPSHGALSGPDENGNFTYTPAGGFLGWDSFTYVANDGHLDSNVAMVNIDVSPYWSPPPYHSPVGNSDVYTAGRNITLTVPAGGVLANDSAAFGYQLTASIAAQPTHGAVTLNSDGSFTYVPTTDYVGTDQFTYSAGDGRSTSAETNVVIHVIVPTSVAMQSFYSDGRSLKIDYSVTDAVPSHAWRIAVYASPDGVSRGAQLWSGAGGMQLGNHTLSFQPTYRDLLQWGDYRLLAVADPAGSLIESETSDNTAQFAGGAFLVHEQFTGKTVLQVQAGDDGDTVTAAIVSGGTGVSPVLRITDNGQSGDYDPAAIDAIHFHGGSGDDAFTSDATLPIDEWLFAGDGSNTLIGGAGDDIIFGGAGNDTLTGNAGQNQIAGGGGSDTIAGNTSNPLPDVFVANSASTIEGQSVQIVLSLDAPPAAQITIPYTVTAEAGLLDGSYGNPTSGTIVIQAGSRFGILQLQTLDHEGDTADYSFSVAFTEPSNAHLKRSTTSVAIYDESKTNPTISLSPSADSGANMVNGAYFVNEDSEFTGTFSLPTPAIQDVTIAFHTEDGTATSPDNYEPVSDTVTIPAGETSVTLTIDIGELTDAQRASPGSASFTVHIDSITGASLPAGATLNQTVTIVNTLDFGEHNVVIGLDWTRIFDLQVDDRYGPLDDGYDGWFADDRHVIVTLTGPDGFSMSELRGRYGTTGDVGFPIPDPNTQYTISVTPVGDLKFGYHNEATGYIQLGVPTSFTFNSSDPSIYNSQGDLEEDFVVLSTHYNSAFNIDDPVYNVPPPPYHLPNAEAPPIHAADEAGYFASEFGGVGELDVDASEGVLIGATDNAGDPPTSFTASLAESATHGNVTLYPDGSFKYVPEPGFHGEDFFRFTVSHNQGGGEGEGSDGQQQQISKLATAYIKSTSLNFAWRVQPTVERWGTLRNWLFTDGADPFTVRDDVKQIQADIKRMFPHTYWFASEAPADVINQRPAGGIPIFQGHSGFLIGVNGFYPKARANGTGDFSKLQVTLIPYILLYKSISPQKINVGGDIMDGPRSITEHERWHVNGVSGNVSDKIREKLGGKDPTASIGFVAGFSNEMMRIAIMLGAENQKPTKDGFNVLFNRLMMEITLSPNTILKAGLWHLDEKDATGALIVDLE